MTLETEVTETQTEQTETQTEQTETQAESVETAQPQANFKIKYNGEEKELSFDEAKTLAQKGMDYDRQKERWEGVKPTFDALEETARLYGWLDENGHGDTNAFLTAMREAKRQEEIEALQTQAQLPKELAEELYKLRQERQQREIEKQQAEARQKAEQDNLDFLKYFRDVNGRPFDEKDTLPEEVIQANQAGVPLRYAYADYLSRQLLSEKQIEQTNQANAESSTGSVNGQGATIEKEFYTSDEVDKLTDADYERNPKLWEIVRKSMLKW